MAPPSVPFKRIALVTGAARGIGRAIALRLADDGCDVAVNDLPTSRQHLEDVVSKIKAKEGRQALAVMGDISREDDAKAMVDSVVERLGGLDVMVANAGIVAFGSIVDLPTEEWDRIVAVNLRGTMLSYKCAARHMIQQGRGGRIIGASSFAGQANSAAYVATKFGIRGMTQSAALDLAKHNITVNAYAPGAIYTPLSGREEDERLGLDPGTTLKKLLGKIGMPSSYPLAEPDVVASLVSYLTKPESHFITGQTISVNGGVYFD